jgi:hypothetical protein
MLTTLYYWENIPQFQLQKLTQWDQNYCGNDGNGNWTPVIQPIASHSADRTIMLNCKHVSIVIIEIRGPFEKFVDSPYYFESELCGGAVTVSFSKYLPCTSYNAPPTSRKRATDRLLLRNFLPRSFLFMVGKAQKAHGRDLDCKVDVLMEFHWSTFSKPNTEFNSDLAPCDFWAFPTMKRELRGKKFRSDQRSAARFREVGRAL